jgi:hypothetical protein
MMKLFRWFVLASLLVGATAAAPVAAGGSASSCSSSGWAATAAGKPAALASASEPSFFVWRDPEGWHLGVKGASSAAPLAAHVLSSAPLHVGDATPGLRAGLHTSLRAISVRIASGGAQQVDFTAPCARSVTFRLGPAQTASGSGGGAAIPAGQRSPRAYLGAVGSAPAMSFQLSRPAVTGVSGRILVGPTCPVIGPGAKCPPAKSASGTVRVETAATTRGGAGGELVTRVQSDADGHFSVNLAPGRYLLVVEKATPGYPVPKPSIVDVEAGVVSDVILVLDTGIR